MKFIRGKRNSNEVNIPRLRGELNCLKKLLGENENFVKILSMYQCGNPANLFIVMELCKDGDLEGFLKKNKTMTEDEAIKVLKHTLNGLAFLNSK